MNCILVFSCQKRRGDYLLGMILATILFLVCFQVFLSQRAELTGKIEEKFAAEQLALVGLGLKNCIYANRKKFLDMDALKRGTDAEEVSTSLSNSSINALLKDYLPTSTNFSALQNIWGDKYKVIFVRNANKTYEVDGVAPTDKDILTGYIVATGGSRKQHSAGTTQGEYWIQTGMRRLALKGGPAFAFVEKLSGDSSKHVLKSNGWETQAGLDTINAQEGDIGYLVVSSVDDAITNKTLSRKKIEYKDENGNVIVDDEPNTMYADIEMTDHNILNTQYVTSAITDTSSVRIDTTLYDTEAEAEDSCRNNWIYAYTKDNAKVKVDANGKIHDATTPDLIIGTYSMNGEATRIDNNGRLYYIFPTNTHRVDGSELVYLRSASGGSASYVRDVKPRLAICRKIGTTQTLAYLGDSRAEDTVSFIVSAVDGDFIPMSFCPGADSKVNGGGTVETFTGSAGQYRINTSSKTGNIFDLETPQASSIFGSGQNAIAPRLFVIPQMVTTGPASYILQGVRAYAETVGNSGWIIHLSALIDKRTVNTTNGSVQHSYWVGNSNDMSFSGSSTAYKTLQTLKNESDSTIHPTEYLSYLRAVVIGVCSGKKYTF